jgi:hypothetical protein
MYNVQQSRYNLQCIKVKCKLFNLDKFLSIQIEKPDTFQTVGLIFGAVISGLCLLGKITRAKHSLSLLSALHFINF